MSNQATISAVLSIALVAAVGTMAYPLVISGKVTPPVHKETAQKPAPVLPAASSAPAPVSYKNNLSATDSAKLAPTVELPATPAATLNEKEPNSGQLLKNTAAPPALLPSQPIAAPTIRELMPHEPRAERRARSRNEKVSHRIATPAVTVKPPSPVAQEVEVKPAHPAAPTTTSVGPPSPEGSNLYEKITPRSEATSTIKKDVVVTVSGDKAWIQIEPTRTITVKKGDEIPSYGKVLEIRKNEVVTEHGTLYTN